MSSWILAATFGALFGISELLPRYRDAPLRALWTWSAAFYLLVNAAASSGALVLMHTLDWNLGLPAGPTRNLVQVLIAGFGAMSLFRSSIFVARIGNEQVLVGPITVLQTCLDASDRGVDRKRARARAREIRRVMRGITVDEAIVDLPQLAFNLMQNVTDIEKAKLASAAENIGKADFDSQAKVYILGLALMTLTGKDALEEAVSLLRNSTTGTNRAGGEDPSEPEERDPSPSGAAPAPTLARPGLAPVPVGGELRASFEALRDSSI